MSTLLQQYLYSSAHKVSNKSDKPLRMGVLSTAMINPAALLDPSLTHPEVILYGIASRDAAAAQRYAQKYHFQRSYGSYQALLDDAAVDAVYISLPNGMHAEWARQALQAGKHVLLEKPFTANVDEARELVELAVRKDVVLEEAFHWQFHPAAHVVESLIKSERYGKVVGTHARMTTPRGSIPKNDIRWQYELGGGALMGMASFCCLLSSPCIFYLLSVPLCSCSMDNMVDLTEYGPGYRHDVRSQRDAVFPGCLDTTRDCVSAATALCQRPARR